ncbi:hypothetical protein NUSPORA_00620 [Nucleospora cyclopteri]
MKNLYDTKQIQEQAQEKRKEQEQADQQIISEAKRIEEQNYQKSKQARMKLEKAADKQKQTTQTMRTQGEKISNARENALKVNKNAHQAQDLAIELHENRDAWGFNCPCLTGFKKWCAKDSTEEKAMKNLRKGRKLTEKDEEEISSDIEEPTGEEYVEGANKTDAELNKILHGLKKINKEANTQTTMANKQKTDLEDISKANEYTEREVKKTSKNLQSDLK